MNFLISSYAWSPAIVCVFSLGWLVLRFSYFKSNPKLLIYLGVFIIVYFLCNLFSIQYIVKAAHCSQPLAIATQGCTLMGQDVTGSLQSFLVIPWLGIGIIPLGGGLAVIGIVMMFGWLAVFKVLGLLCVVYLIITAYKVSKHPVTPVNESAPEITSEVADTKNSN